MVPDFFFLENVTVEIGSKRVKCPRAVSKKAEFSSSTVDATHHFSSTVDHRYPILVYFWSTVDEKYRKSSTSRRRSTASWSTGDQTFGFLVDGRPHIRLFWKQFGFFGNRCSKKPNFRSKKPNQFGFFETNSAFFNQKSRINGRRQGP